MIDETLVFEIFCTTLNVLLLGQLAGLFASQYRKAREPLSLLMMLCFIAFCISQVFYFLRFFVEFNPLYYRLEVSLRFTTFAAFVNMFEKSMKQHRLPILTILCVVGISLILFLPYEQAYFAGFTIYAAALAIFWFFLRLLRQTDGKIHSHLRWSLVGAFILGIGIGLSADYMVQTIGRIFVSVGLVVELTGMIIIGVHMYAIRTTDEFMWAQNLQTLFIIYNSLSLLAFDFEQNEMLKQGDLLGGGLATVLVVTQSIMKTQEPPEHIEYQDRNFLIQIGDGMFGNNRCIAVLLVKKNLIILQEKLKNFLRNFEQTFKKELEDWSGNTTPFTERNDELIKIFQMNP